MGVDTKALTKFCPFSNHFLVFTYLCTLFSHLTCLTNEHASLAFLKKNPPCNNFSCNKWHIFSTVHTIFLVIYEVILPACSFIRVSLFIRQVRVSCSSGFDNEFRISFLLWTFRNFHEYFNQSSSFDSTDNNKQKKLGFIGLKIREYS